MSPPYRKVYAAEKYAELAAYSEERPVCEKHGKLQTWQAKADRPAGGQWACNNNHTLERREKVENYRRTHRQLAHEIEHRWRKANRSKINAAARRRSQTPGTFLYKAMHGLGLPGEIARAKTRRYYWRQRLAAVEKRINNV